ncbi:MAG: GYD domain-containing protein [Pirellulales bacterium]
MATFVSTIKFSEQGIKNVKDTCKRAEAFKGAAKKMGVKVREIFWTLGPFDGLMILDAPDDETATALMLQLGSLGNVHTQTARAYNAAEMQAILGKLSG